MRHSVQTAAEGDPNNVGHVITTAGGSGPSKQVIRYLTERVVGNGSFGVVFQAKCIETGETVRAAVRRLPLQCLLAHAPAWRLQHGACRCGWHTGA